MSESSEERRPTEEKDKDQGSVSGTGGQQNGEGDSDTADTIEDPDLDKGDNPV